MKVEDEILQAIRNQSAFAIEGFKIIMATMQDFEKTVAEVNEQFKTVTAKQADMQASLKSAVSDLGTAVASGHTTLIEKMVTTMNGFGTLLTALEAAMDAAHTEFKAALATVPTTPPSLPPAA